MKHRRIISLVCSACVMWLASTPVARAEWHEDACRPGEGVTVIVDWSQVTEGQDTDLVRCIVLDGSGTFPGQTPGMSQLVAVLQASGVEYELDPSGLIVSVAGVRSDLMNTSWNFTGGKDGQWLAQQYYLPTPEADTFVGVTIGTMGANPTPVRVPQLAPDEPEPPEPPVGPTGDPTGEPTTQPTSDPTGEPTTQPTGEPIGDPTGEPSTTPDAEPVDGPRTDGPSPDAAPDSQPSTAPDSHPDTAPNNAPEVRPPRDSRRPQPSGSQPQSSHSPTPLPRPDTTREPADTARSTVSTSPRSTATPHGTQRPTETSSSGPTNSAVNAPPSQVWGQESTERGPDRLISRTEASPWTRLVTLAAGVAVFGGLSGAFAWSLRHARRGFQEEE